MNSEPNTVGGSAGHAPLHVLLIEDSPLIRRSLVEAIDASGSLRVAAYADSADEAIALLADEAFDAVIVDLQLKQGSGVPVFAYLQREKLIDSVFAAVLTNYALPRIANVASSTACGTSMTSRSNSIV